MEQHIVRFDYDPRKPDELRMRKGDIIHDVVKTGQPNGWYRGTLDGKVGLYPENFATVMTDQEAAKYQKMSSRRVPDQDVHNQNSVAQLANRLGTRLSDYQHHQHQQQQHPYKPQQNNPHSNQNRDKKKRAKVIFSYQAQNDDEISLEIGSNVIIENLVEDGWYMGIADGRRGCFPSNFIEILKDDVNEISDSQTQVQAKKVTGVGLGNIFDGQNITLKSIDQSDTQIEPKSSRVRSKKQPVTVPRRKYIFNNIKDVYYGEIPSIIQRDDDITDDDDDHLMQIDTNCEDEEQCSFEIVIEKSHIEYSTDRAEYDIDLGDTLEAIERGMELEDDDNNQDIDDLVHSNSCSKYAKKQAKTSMCSSGDACNSYQVDTDNSVISEHPINEPPINETPINDPSINDPSNNDPSNNEPSNSEYLFGDPMIPQVPVYETTKFENQQYRNCNNLDLTNDNNMDTTANFNDEPLDFGYIEYEDSFEDEMRRKQLLKNMNVSEASIVSDDSHTKKVKRILEKFIDMHIEPEIKKAFDTMKMRREQKKDNVPHIESNKSIHRGYRKKEQKSARNALSVIRKNPNDFSHIKEDLIKISHLQSSHLPLKIACSTPKRVATKSKNPFSFTKAWKNARYSKKHCNSMHSIEKESLLDQQNEPDQHDKDDREIGSNNNESVIRSHERDAKNLSDILKSTSPILYQEEKTVSTNKNVKNNTKSGTKTASSKPPCKVNSKASYRPGKYYSTDEYDSTFDSPPLSPALDADHHHATDASTLPIHRKPYSQLTLGGKLARSVTRHHSTLKLKFSRKPAKPKRRRLPSLPDQCEALNDTIRALEQNEVANAASNESHPLHNLSDAQTSGVISLLRRRLTRVFSRRRRSPRAEHNGDHSAIDQHPSSPSSPSNKPATDVDQQGAGDNETTAHTMSKRLNRKPSLWRRLTMRKARKPSITRKNSTDDSLNDLVDKVNQMSMFDDNDNPRAKTSATPSHSPQTKTSHPQATTPNNPIPESTADTVYYTPIPKAGFRSAYCSSPPRDMPHETPLLRGSSFADRVNNSSAFVPILVEGMDPITVNFGRHLNVNSKTSEFLSLRRADGTLLSTEELLFIQKVRRKRISETDEL